MSGCVSRWKVILSEYRTTILKSHALLEKTGLTLFHINESTLIRWYKNTLMVQAFGHSFRVCAFLPSHLVQLTAFLRPVYNPQSHHHHCRILTSSQILRTQVDRQGYGITLPPWVQATLPLLVPTLVLQVWAPLLFLLYSSAVASGPSSSTTPHLGSPTQQHEDKKFFYLSVQEHMHSCLLYKRLIYRVVIMYLN